MANLSVGDLDYIETVFRDFTWQNKQYHDQALTYAEAQSRLPESKRDGFKQGLPRLSYIISSWGGSKKTTPEQFLQAVRRGDEAPKDYKISKQAQEIINLSGTEKKSEEMFLNALTKAGMNPSVIVSFILQINKQTEAGKTASLADISYTGNDGKNYTLANWLETKRTAIREAEERQQAQEAKAAGIESLKETTGLVASGAIINVAGTAQAHEAARIEVAGALERYFAEPSNVSAEARKSLGLDENAALTLLANGQITDRKLLSKALRLYQESQSIVADGKVGLTTLSYLLSDNAVRSDFWDRDLLDSVSQTAPNNIQPGYLCSKVNPCELRNYVSDDKDPRDGPKQVARRNLLNVEGLFIDLHHKVDGQTSKVAVGDASKVYTQQEHEQLAALFAAAADGKGKPIDNNQPISSDHIKAFQEAFGLKVDGIIGKETARALMQVEIRLATDQVVDPSEIHNAVAAHTPAKAKSKAAEKQA